jgi:serine/threonine protein phosphatase PrpC
MEDQTHLLPHPRFNEEAKVGGGSRSFFAVYDGHAGTVCAKYCVQHVHVNVARDGEFPRDQEKAVINGLLTTEKEFTKGCHALNLVHSSGTTAIIALFNDNTLTIANVGDSRAVLCRAGVAVPMSIDHKPGRPDEMKRISVAGGKVGVTEDEAFDRVSMPCCCRSLRRKVSSKPLRVFPGGLSVARTIGDIGLKATGLIISTPEAKTVSLVQDDEVLVLACDGVWDVLSNQDVVDIARKNRGDPEKASIEIARRAFRYGSNDNISVITIALHWEARKAC